MNFITSFVSGIMIAWSALFGGHAAQYSATVSNLPTVVANYQDSLATQENTGDSSFTLVSGEDSLGRSLSGFYCFTVDPNTSIAEYECGNASGTVVTAVTRGIDPVNPNATSSAIIFTHRRGASVVISDYTPIANQERILQGLDTLPSGTVLQYNPNVTNAEVGAAQNNIASVAYVASTSFAGTTNGSLAQKGIYQEATPAQIASSTGVGSTGADLIVPNRNSCLTSSTTTCSVVASGTLDPSFLAGGNYNLNNVNVSGTLTSQATTTLPLLPNTILGTNASGSIIATSTPLAIPVYIYTAGSSTAFSFSSSATTTLLSTSGLLALGINDSLQITVNVYNILQLNNAGIYVNGNLVCQNPGTFILNTGSGFLQATITNLASTSIQFVSCLSNVAGGPGTLTATTTFSEKTLSLGSTWSVSSTVFSSAGSPSISAYSMQVLQIK